MKNEKTFLPPNLGLAPFCKSRGMTLQIAQLQQTRAFSSRNGTQPLYLWLRQLIRM